MSAPDPRAGTRSQRRWLPIVGLTLLVIGLGSAIYSLSVGEGGPGTFLPKGLEETQQLLGGLRQDGDRLGDPSAPIELALFTDLRDRSCARFEQDVVNPLIEEYVRTGKAQFAIHHFDLGATEITEAAIASVAAGDQGRQWQFANLVLANLDEAGPQGADKKFLREIAEVTPEMETDKWETAYDDPKSEQTARDDADLARNEKLPAQPAIAVTGPDGAETLTETPSLDEVKAAIAKVGGS